MAVGVLKSMHPWHSQWAAEFPHQPILEQQGPTYKKQCKANKIKKNLFTSFLFAFGSHWPGLPSVRGFRGPHLPFESQGFCPEDLGLRIKDGGCSSSSTL